MHTAVRTQGIRILALCAVALFCLVAANTAQAALVPFGGRSATYLPCTCMPGWFFVTVKGPRPAALMFGPGSLLFLNYVITPPAYQLGTADVPEICMVWVGKKCLPKGKGLRVQMDGTSLY